MREVLCAIPTTTTEQQWWKDDLHNLGNEHIALHEKILQNQNKHHNSVECSLATTGIHRLHKFLPSSTAQILTFFSSFTLVFTNFVRTLGFDVSGYHWIRRTLSDSHVWYIVICHIIVWLMCEWKSIYMYICVKHYYNRHSSISI